MSLFRAELNFDSAEARVGRPPGSDTPEGRRQLRLLAERALTIDLAPLPATPAARAPAPADRVSPAADSGSDATS